MKGPSLRLALPAPLTALLEPPLPDLRVVAREQDLGHLATAPARGSGVVRVLRAALEGGRERLLERAVGVPEGAGELANHRIAHHHRRQLATGDDVRADRDHIRR